MHIPFRRLAVAGIVLLPGLAFAQDAALNDKLRDLLRQTTEQMRAAQDNAASVQAQLDAMTKQRDALQQQLTEAQAKPAAPVVTPQQQAALKQAQTQAQAAQAQLSAAASDNARLQKAYQDATAIARDTDASNQRNSASLKQTSVQLTICKRENASLIATAEDILHLYQTPKWNQLLIANHDRLLGFARVKLENQVQDYEDKIEAQGYLEPVGK